MQGRAKAAGRPTAPAPVARATGREKLIDAVVRLGSTARSIGSLGLREVAREAGLNPNTFYRHFRDFDDLGVAIIERVSAQLRSGLRERRTLPRAGSVWSDDVQTIIRESVGLAFEFVLQNRALVVIGIRELHGDSPVLRKALRQVVDDVAREMAEDTLELPGIDALDAALVHELSRGIIRQMCVLALEYLERPDERAALRREAERFILLLFVGALATTSTDARFATKSAPEPLEARPASRGKGSRAGRR